MKDFEELRKSMDDAIAKAVKARNIAIDALTEEQVCQVFKQAIECGDISMHVVATSSSNEHRQGAVYIPFAEKQRLESRIKELERDA